MGKNPPAKAGDTGSIPGRGRFHMMQSNEAHVPQQGLQPQLLSPRAVTTEAGVPGACAPHQE